MSLSQKDKPVISEAAALREVYGPNAAKKIAREFRVAVVTAKVWLSGRFPMTRRDELAERIRARLDRRDELSAEIRQIWASGGAGETIRAVDSGQARVDRTPPDRLGRKVKF